METMNEIQARKQGEAGQENTMGHCKSLPDVECVSSVFHGYRAVSKKSDVDTERQTGRERKGETHVRTTEAAHQSFHPDMNPCEKQ